MLAKHPGVFAQVKADVRKQMEPGMTASTTPAKR